MSPEAQNLLRELKNRPEWFELLDEIKREKKVRYKPHLETDQNAQFHDWVYYSGVNVENARIIKLLGGSTPQE